MNLGCKIIHIRAPYDTAKDITTLCRIYNRTPNSIIVGLIITAAKYNYLPNGSYIPCTPQRSSDKFLSQPPCRDICVALYSEIAQKVSVIQHANYIKTYSGAALKIIQNALYYDYNDKLHFSPPTPISQPPATITNQDKSKPSILLDII